MTRELENLTLFVDQKNEDGEIETFGIDLSELGSTGPSDWDDIGNKPPQFPPQEHTHVVTDIADLEKRLGEIVTSGKLTVTGKSAYQSWLELPGNAGKTETEFIASLRGEKGETGATGTPGIQGPAGRDGITPDLSDYATKSYVDGKLDDLELGTSVPGIVTWGNVTEKPQQFPPTSHIHPEYATISYVNSTLGMEGRTIGTFSTWGDVAVPAGYMENNHLRFSAKAMRCLVDLKVTILAVRSYYTSNPLDVDNATYQAGDVVLDVRIALPHVTEKSTNDWVDEFYEDDSLFYIPREDTTLRPVTKRLAGGVGYYYDAEVAIKAFDMDDTSKLIYSNNKLLAFGARE